MKGEAELRQPGSEELLHWSKPAAASVFDQPADDGTTTAEVRYDCVVSVN